MEPFGNFKYLFGPCQPIRVFFRTKIIFNILYFDPGWHDVYDTQGKAQGQLFLKIKYKPYEDNFGQTELPCPDTYFPLRKGNRVTLYSCARNGTFGATLRNADHRPKPSLWLDLYRSLVAATKFIYITGWSVNTNIKLLR